MVITKLPNSEQKREEGAMKYSRAKNNNSVNTSIKIFLLPGLKVCTGAGV
jgi:hypothetical protein